MDEPRPKTETGRRLLAELQESPLDGARYAWNVVRQRLSAIEHEAAMRAAPPGPRPVTGSQGIRNPYYFAQDAWISEWRERKLPMRLFHAVVRHGFTIADVRVTPDEVLLEMRNFGHRSLCQLREIVPVDGRNQRDL